MLLRIKSCVAARRVFAEAVSPFLRCCSVVFSMNQTALLTTSHETRCCQACSGDVADVD